jgi:hypothetical protein
MPLVSDGRCSPGTREDDMLMRGMWHADHVGLCGVGAYYFKLFGKLECMASGCGVESFNWLVAWRVEPKCYDELALLKLCFVCEVFSSNFVYDIVRKGLMVAI